MEWIAILEGLKTVVNLVGGIFTTRDKIRQEYASLNLDEYDIAIKQADALVSKTEGDIALYDDFLSNWQANYDADLATTQMQGQNNLDQLLANWSDYEVATAARGAVGGSAALVAANRKAKAVQYAGSDLSLAGDDGVYGTSLAALKSNLLQERRQAELQHETDIRQLDINKASADAARAAYKSAAERKGELYDKYKGFAGLDEDARATELYGQKKQALDEEYKQLYPRGVKWYKLGRV